jgi:hypothetical protein
MQDARREDAGTTLASLVPTNTGGLFMNQERTGISNRETPAEEEKERRDHPPEATGSPEPEDAAGRVGETPKDEVPQRQTSHKAGSRSIAQKEERTRYPDRGMPATRKKAGAFGAEPRDEAADEGPDRDEP